MNSLEESRDLQGTCISLLAGTIQVQLSKSFQLKIVNTYIFIPITHRAR